MSLATKAEAPIPFRQGSSLDDGGPMSQAEHRGTRPVQCAQAEEPLDELDRQAQAQLQAHVPLLP